MHGMTDGSNMGGIWSRPGYYQVARSYPEVTHNLHSEKRKKPWLHGLGILFARIVHAEQGLRTDYCPLGHTISILSWTGTEQNSNNGAMRRLEAIRNRVNFSDWEHVGG